MVEILEPVNVWVFFKNNAVQPYLFFWKGRPIKVDTVNLIHNSRSGASLFYHFSITSNSNFYRIRFDTSKLNWFLELAEEGD